MTKQEHIQALLAVYAKKREALSRLRDERTEEVSQKCPEVASFIAESRVLFRSAIQSVSAKPANLKEISVQVQKAAEELQSRLADALVQNGYPADYLQPKPECPQCGDNGVIPNSFPQRYCPCFEMALASRVRTAAQTEQSFATFNLDIFPNDTLLPCGLTQRDYAHRVRRLLESYVQAYPANDKPSITLLGKSGLGKTFLCNCVSQALRERGFSVLQVTAFQMLQAARSKHRQMEDMFDEFDEMLEAPYLILDDLGSEPMLNNVTIEYLYALLNERQIHARPTFVVSNFSVEELRSRYTERISSRLLDGTRCLVIELQGEDLRMQRR